jgi:hypothetical protein
MPVHAVTSHWVVAPLPFAVAAADAYAWLTRSLERARTRAS